MNYVVMSLWAVGVPRLRSLGVMVAVVIGAAGCSRGRGETITQDVLVRRTQEILDAVARGDRQPFERHFAADSMIFDEKGRGMDKRALLADQSPMEIWTALASGRSRALRRAAPAGPAVPTEPVTLSAAG
jgi:hypothetical protein